jgi:hypothetical protein
MSQEAGKREKEKHEPAVVRLPFPLFLFPLAFLLFLIGCHSENPRPGTNTDPLLGPVSIQPAGNGAGAVSPGSARPAGPLPPLPAPGSATSNAAVAPGLNQTFDPSRDLRIGGGNPGVDGNNGGWRGPGDVTLNQPEPVDSLAARSETRPLPPAPLAPAYPPVTARGASPEASLLSQVAARGAKFQMLQTWGETGEWKFSCAIPNRQNPHIRRTYEARAGDPLSAIQAVLDQIDHEQH